MNKLELTVYAGLVLGTGQAVEAKDRTGPAFVEIKSYEKPKHSDTITDKESKDSQRNQIDAFNLFFNAPGYMFQNSAPTSQQTTGQVQPNFRINRTIIPSGNSGDDNAVKDNPQKWSHDEKAYANKLNSKFKAVNKTYFQRVHSATNGPYFRT